MLKKFFSSSENKKKQVHNPAVQNTNMSNSKNINDSSIKQSQQKQEAKYPIERIEQVWRLRQALSPEECLLKDGQLDFSYFTEQVNESWKENRDGKRLLRGIQKHGIGNWLSNEQIEEIHQSNMKEGERNGNLQFSLLQDPSLLRLKKKHIQDLNELYQGKIQAKVATTERSQNKRKYNKRRDDDDQGDAAALKNHTLTLDRFFRSKRTKCKNQNSPQIKQDGEKNTCIYKRVEETKRKQQLIEEKKNRKGKQSPDIDELTKTNSQDCCPLNVEQ